MFESFKPRYVGQTVVAFFALLSLKFPYDAGVPISWWSVGLLGIALAAVTFGSWERTFRNCFFRHSRRMAAETLSDCLREEFPKFAVIDRWCVLRRNAFKVSVARSTYLVAENHNEDWRLGFEVAFSLHWSEKDSAGRTLEDTLELARLQVLLPKTGVARPQHIWRVWDGHDWSSLSDYPKARRTLGEVLNRALIPSDTVVPLKATS